MGVDLPVDLPIWALTVKAEIAIQIHWQIYLGGRSANFEHTLCFILCFTEGPFVYTKDQQKKLAETETDKEHYNPYKKVILNKVYQHEDKTAQMENWSILSDNIRDVQHDEKLKTPHKLGINTSDYHQYKELYYKLKGEKSHTLDVDFGINPETTRSNYSDMYEGVHTDMVYTNRFDEYSDLSTTYFG